MNTHSFSTRLLAMLLSLMMVLGMVPANVLAAEAETEPAQVQETADPSEAPEAETAEVPEEETQVAVEETEAPVVETTEAAAEEIPVETSVEEIPEEAPVVADDFFIEEDDFFIEEAPVVEAAAQPVLAEGRYTVPVVELKSSAPIPAIAAAFKEGFGKAIQLDVDADGTMTATILPQHMAPVMAEIAYHCNILKIMANSVEATYPQMQTQLVTRQFGAADTQEIQCPAKAVVVLPAFDEQKAGYPMQVTVDFMNGMYGDINTDNWMDVVLKLDLANAKKENIASEADIKAAAAVDSKIDAIGSNITLGSDYAVTKAREAYEALTEAQKALVTKLDVLEAAEKAVLDIKTPVFTAPKNGVYDATVTMLHEYKEQSSMCDPMFDAKAEIVVKDDTATVTILVANPVPAFPDQGADGTVKNMFIDYGGQHYAFESQLGTDAMMTAKVSSPLFGFETGSQYPAQVLTVTLPSQAIGVGSRLATNAYVNVVMNSDQIFRMNLTSLEVNPDAAAAAAVDAKIEAIGEVTGLGSAYKVSSAREAYEALTEAQKALVTKLDVLEAAEQTILDLKTPVYPAPTNGRYAATVTMLHEYKAQPSMCDIMFDAKADIVVKDGMATVTILVANPVPGFPEQGADGTVKNVFIDYGGKQYAFESQLGTDAMMTAKDSNPLFGFEKGSQYPAQVLTVTLPAQSIGEGTSLVTNAYVNVVMNSDQIFRMNLTDLTKLIPDNPFVDVSEKAYYYTPVLWAVENNITSGVNADHFEPNTKCTRAQIVTFLWNAAGKPEPKTAVNPFRDVSEKAYYYKAVLWAVENGITYGVDDTHFGPGVACTRAQAVTFIWNSKGNPEPKTARNPFQDVSKKAYYYNAVLWAVENEITKGLDDTHFAPMSTCTRGQIVRFLWCADGQPAI